MARKRNWRKTIAAGGVIAVAAGLFEFLLSRNTILLVGGVVAWVLSDLAITYFTYRRVPGAPPLVPPMSRREEKVAIWGGLASFFAGIAWLVGGITLVLQYWPGNSNLLVYAVFIPASGLLVFGGSAILMVLVCRYWSPSD